MKLHLGCGKRYLTGYTHIDLTKNDNIDHVCDICDLKSVIKDTTVDEIYACHVFEHIGRKKVYDVLCEWNRVLKKDAIMRIAVPNFEQVVDLYNKDKNNWVLLIGQL